MRRIDALLVCLALGPLGACGDSSGDGSDDAGSSDSGGSPTSAPGTTSPASTSSTTGMSTTGMSTTGMPTTGMTTADPDSSTTDPPMTSEGSSSSSDSGSTSGSSSSSTSGGAAEFPPAEPFGDDVLETDLVGDWGLNWATDPAPQSRLTIAGDGSWTWVEDDVGCTTQTTSSGQAWVSGSQLVLHAETWERALPWDPQTEIGVAVDVPFRVAMSFTLQGNGAESYLALSGPPALVEFAAYTGESLVRVDVQGVHLGGEWRGEAELEALLEGYATPQVVVRSVFQAFMDAELDPMDPQGLGVGSHTETFFPVAHQNITYNSKNWTCLDGCPDPAGTTFIDGTNLYTYGPYGGWQHLMTFEDGRAFLLQATGGCG